MASVMCVSCTRHALSGVLLSMYTYGGKVVLSQCAAVSEHGCMLEGSHLKVILGLSSDHFSTGALVTIRPPMTWGIVRQEGG